MASIYGIDENSPLFKKGAPSQFNADLSLIDLGKSDKVVAPTAIGNYADEDGYRRIIMSDGREIKSKHKAKQTQGSRKTAPKSSFVDVNTLTPAQAYFAQIHGLKTRDKNGRVVVDITKIPTTFKTQKDPKFGNDEVE